jgi:hypothetical protein
MPATLFNRRAKNRIKATQFYEEVPMQASLNQIVFYKLAIVNLDSLEFNFMFFPSNFMTYSNILYSCPAVPRHKYHLATMSNYDESRKMKAPPTSLLTAGCRQ